MKYGYIIRPRADRDIDEIVDYLVEEAGLDTGLQFLDEVHETLALLAAHRELGWRCNIRHRQLTTARTFRVSDRFDKFLISTSPTRIESRFSAFSTARRTWPPCSNARDNKRIVRCARARRIRTTPHPRSD
ncbi:MAG: type II toxin-antitoxin system RelE/ParE family toxin [Bryobacterales bacterium]|nr:type II toxin-antitoxin system RelE/ParE family toxin [Bryobacterales bacterium]